MAQINRPFDPTGVNIIDPDLMIRFDDPIRQPSQPMIRPEVSRYAGSGISLMHLEVISGFLDLFSPVTGTGRTITFGTPLPGTSIDRLLEISPIPFQISSLLQELKAGLPTFYLGWNPGPDLTDDDELYVIDTTLATVDSDIYFGVLFQDRMPLSPWAWIEIIRDALENTGDQTSASNWNELASLNNVTTSLKVLDHHQELRTGASFDIRIKQSDGTFEGPWTRTTASDGDLEQAVFANPLPRQGGPQNSLFSNPDEQPELSWQGDPFSGETPLSVLSLYESGASAPPGAPLLLPGDLGRGHLQTLDLTRWFASPPPTSDLARFHLNSRVEPLVDGVLAFKLLADDLKACATPGNGAHLACWGLKDFPLVPGDESTSILKLTEFILKIENGMETGTGGDIRFLIEKFVKFKEGADLDNDILTFGSRVLLVLIITLIMLNEFKVALTSKGVFAPLLALGGLTLGLVSFKEIIEEKLDLGNNLEILPQLNDIKENIAVWSAYQSRFDDNPISQPLPFGLADYLEQIGINHQKIQLVKREPDVEGNQYIAYIGGMDVNENRVDTPGHQVASPYHDVHARITGPVVTDIFKTWDERYSHDKEALGADALNPVFAPPATPENPDVPQSQSARHISQIARTYYKPDLTQGEAPYDFAQEGEALIHDTLTRAIKAAREYIYIEDQYFVPNDSDPEGSATTIFDALLEAANHCQRLIIVLPSEPDQPFSELRRRNLLVRLKAAWGGRAQIGAPLRRPVLPKAGVKSHEGRCRLMKDIAVGDDIVVLGPKVRVPGSTPFWLWIDGELMLSKGIPSEITIDETLSMSVEVMRGPSGSNPRWNANRRAHKKGTAVSLNQLKGIIVHSKVMIVDDVFVSIGSANLNRRGLLHDGEINIFSIPEALKSSQDNPARDLRTALWAEQLGLVPAIGPAILADPIAAFELFRRTNFEGNRFTGFEALDVNAYLSIPLGDTFIFQILGLTGLNWVENQIPLLWNTVIDPTSFIDPDPENGPT